MDFEAGMRLVHDEIGGAVPQLMREMAVYFIQFRPINAGSLYCRLVAELKGRNLVSKVLMSTLNYECSLEFSIANAGIPVAYFDNAPGSIPVWKLHGSCNMFAAGLQAGQGISYGTGVTWEGGIRALPTPDEVIQHCLIETALAPVMSLYMEGKILNVSPAAIRQLQADWAKAVAGAADVVCVGVRPHPSDSHIWLPMFQSAATLHFIGDHEAFSQWRQGRIGDSRFVSSRFNEGFASLTKVLAAHAN